MGECERPRLWTEERAAAFQESVGNPVREVDGRWWYGPTLGSPAHLPDAASRSQRATIWRPVDLLRPLDPAPGRSPVRGALGWLALTESGANSTLPLNVVPDLQSYEMDRLSRNRRRTLRRAAPGCTASVLTEPGLLLEQGFAVQRSAVARTGQPGDSSERAFRQRIERMWADGPGLAVATTVDGRLGDFVLGYQIGDRAYLFEHSLADWAGPSAAGTVSRWLVLRTLRDWGARVAYSGPWFPEYPWLAAFKKSFGSRIVHAPARVQLNPALATYLRLRRPVTYRRLGGPGWARDHGFDPDDDSALRA